MIITRSEHSGVLENLREVLESIDLGSSQEELDEATEVTNPHIVQERKGRGISVTINGKEYRYVSPDIATEKLFKSFMGMYFHANAGYKALNYLRKNALCYYGARATEGKDLVESYDYSDDFDNTDVAEAAEYGDSSIYSLCKKKRWASDSEMIKYFRSNKYLIHNYKIGDEIITLYNATTKSKSKYPLKRSAGYIEIDFSRYKINETTQPSAIPSTKDAFPVEKFYEELKQELLNEAVDGKSLFNLSKTGMSYYDDFLNPKDHDYKRLVKGVGGHIEYMSPDEYLLRCARDIFHKPLANITRGLDEDNIQEYAEKMANGVKFNLPMLNYAQETQEGRHRALAAKKLGAKQIPVLIVEPWDIRDTISIPKNFKFNLWYGHTLQYTDKSGMKKEIKVGLDLKKMQDTILQVVKSRDYNY